MAPTIMANERGHQIVFIREVEIVMIVPSEKSKFCLKITAGNKKQKTEEIKIDRTSPMPKWTINMDLGDLDPQTVVSWKLYGRRRLRLKVLGSVENTLGELFEGGSTSTDIHLFNGTSEIAVLKISGSSSSKALMDELVPSIKKPSEKYKFLDSTETLGTVFDAVKGMIDTLAGVHPAATVAWGFLSIGFKVLKNQHDVNQAICDLYKDMISVYEVFSKDDILAQRDRLQEIYSSLFKQTIECAMFIEGYANKSEIERLFKIDVSGQAEQFRQAFIDLKSQLSMGFAKESVIVTLGVQEFVIGVQERVDLQTMRDQLKQHLKPPQELDPKSKCTQGTRVETINTMMSWISRCNGGTMWCKGLAGTGKSSLVGTLHDLLIADIGGRSRLAAFIRYDRIEYSKASKLIASIAYALGMFDERIGMAISKAVQTRWPVDPSAQFQRLLRGPLESLPGLLDGGPLVVIVDGLDESDVSDDMLAVLAEGFGPKLPFMRLIVSSRPVHRIATAFEGRDSIYILYLDTSSDSINRDIHFYLGLQLNVDNRDPVFQAKCKQLNAVDELAARASGLFIWAATIAKFICGWPGISRLEAVLATDIPSDAAEALTTLYRTTLNTLVFEIPGANADIKTCLRNVLGAVLVAKTSDDEFLRLELPGMTEDILDNIVLVDEGGPPSHYIISMLGSVLTPESEDEAIQLIHKSLADFLQDRNRCGDEWFVDVTQHYRALAKRCLDVSKSFLQKWSSNINMNIGTIPVYISQYALLGVLWHVKAFDDSGLELASFFHGYFLLWLDVLLCIKCSSILSSLLMVLNWSNQFGNTESRTLFYHAYLFAYRASQYGGHSSSGPSYAMSHSPSSNVIRKAWERLNNSDSPIFSGKERLLCYMTHGSYILLPDSNSLMTFDVWSSFKITQYEINTGQQKSRPERYHGAASFPEHYMSCLVTSECSIILMTYEVEMPPPTSDWIRLSLPSHNHPSLSQKTPNKPSWMHIILFDSRTWTLKTYVLFLSQFHYNDFSTAVYDNGVVIAHKVGYFMKIAIGQEDNFAWTSIPAYCDLRIHRDGSIIILVHPDDTIQLYDARSGATVFDPLHTDGHIIAVSDDGSKIILQDRDSKAASLFDMALGGSSMVIAIFDGFVEHGKALFLGESKIAYILNERLIIQSLVTGNILFHHGIPKDEYDDGGYGVRATPDGARVVISGLVDCMVWDVGDL